MSARGPARVLLTVPYYQTVEGEGLSMWGAACAPPDEVIQLLRPDSFLARNFNTLWTYALNHRLKCTKCEWVGSTPDYGCGKCGAPCTLNITHVAMIHADVEPKEPLWLGRMLDELVHTQADLLHVVLPIKTREGYTSTALENVETGGIRRLTMREVEKIEPITFDAEQAGFPGYDLLASSGLWVVDFSQSWVEDVWFEVRDRILRLSDGTFATETMPEDWHFSKLLHRLERKVVGSTCVRAEHWGRKPYPNYEAWGEEEHDKEQGDFSWVEEPSLGHVVSE